MAKKDNDLFDRLRDAGLRKQVARRLSELSDGASKKATRAARSTATEFRAIADEIERRLPSAARPASATRKASSRTSTRKASTRSRSGTGSRRASRSTAATTRASQSTAASTRASRSTAGAKRASRSTAGTKRASRSTAASATSSGRASATARKPAPARRRKTASAASGARAPRGANKAKILQSLKAGPKTATEIAKETGIGAGTVGSTLSKMAVSGEVRKAQRGYGLPS
jgi:hypothetical protein